MALAGAIGLLLACGSAAPAASPSIEAPAVPSPGTAGCGGGGECEAPVLLAESTLLQNMREWRSRGLMAPRREVRRAVAQERRATRRSSRDGRSASRERRSRGGGVASVRAGSGETFTTMCVRTCDGFFFPISFSTTQDRFAADQFACQARCPGMEVRLYTYKVMSETSEQLRGLDGTPYSSLTNAFLYKLKGPSKEESCGCKVPLPAMQPAPLPTDETETLRAGLPTLSAVPLPRWRPDSNALAAIETATLADDAAPRAEKTIRVVGPAFFPDR